MNTPHQLTTPRFFRDGTPVAGQHFFLSCTGMTRAEDLRKDLIDCDFDAALAARAHYAIAIPRTIDAPDLLPLGGSVANGPSEITFTLRERA
jgi:hypothetical protein